MNGGGVFTIDSKNNLYMGHLYNSAVYKIPFVSGAYVALSDLSTAPNCTGTDTAICTVANLPSGGMKAIAFDASGNLYMVTVPAAPGVNAIYECNVACQVGGTATLVYSDTTGAVSQIAFDPWGNLFFTDGIYNDASFQNDDKVTQLQPLRAALYSGNGLCGHIPLSCRPSPTPLLATTTISWMAWPLPPRAPSTTQTRTMECLPSPTPKPAAPTQRTNTLCRPSAQRVWSLTQTATSGSWSITPAATTSVMRSSATW